LRGHVDLFVENCLRQARRAKSGVDVRQAKPVNGQVGGRVVAEDNHEVERVAEVSVREQ